MTGLSPGRRLLWDSFDATMRERVEHLPFRGESGRKAALTLSGGMRGAGTGAEAKAALRRLGYTGPEKGGWLSAGVSGDVVPVSPPSSSGAITLGCWSFSPSADRTQCGNDCIDEMFDDSAGLCDDAFLDCGSPTRTVSSSSLDALSNAFFGDTSLGFVQGPRIRGTVEAEKELITAAWNLILQNMDLVKWAVCKATGDLGTTWRSGTAERAWLISRINGSLGVTVHVVNAVGTYMSVYGSSIIWVSRGGKFTHSMELWTGGTHQERLCAAVDLAATLFHELTHLAGFTYADFDDEECYQSYKIESAFRWALANRYPDTGCCEKLRKSYVYGCGSPIYAHYNECSSHDIGWDPSKSAWEVIVDALAFLADGARMVVGAVVGFILWGVEEVYEGAPEVLGRVVDWLVDLFDGFDNDGGGGGCCGCACNRCYEYCPSFFRNDCVCTPLIAMDHPAMMDCQLRCVKGMIEDGAELSSDATTVET